MRKGPARRRHTESAPKAGAPGSLTSPPQAGSSPPAAQAGTWRSQSPEAREAGGPAQHVEGRARGRDGGAREPLQHGRMGKASRPVSGTQGESVGHPGARCEAPARNLPGGRCCGRQRAARSRARRRWRPLRPHAPPTWSRPHSLHLSHTCRRVRPQPQRPQPASSLEEPGDPDLMPSVHTMDCACASSTSKLRGTRPQQSGGTTCQFLLGPWGQPAGQQG